MSFSTILFTEKGRALQSKVLAGAVLTFTRIGMGSGSLGGQSQIALNNLIDQKVSLSVTQVMKSGNYAVVEGNFRNADVSTGFYWRELGIFAQDPDIGEILYCYGNAGSLAEYIPPQSSEIVEKVVGLSVIVGDTANVTLLTDSTAFATKAEVKTAQEKADQAFQSASNGKEAIKAAITGIDPTVTIPTDATFAQLAAAIGQIETGIDTSDATATAEYILAGLTAYVKGVKVTGTGVNNGPVGAETVNLATQGAEYSIAKGFHSGLRKIKATITNLVSGNIRAGVSVGGVQGKSTVVDTEDAVLDPAYLLTGYSGYDDGIKKAGTMPNFYGAWQVALSTSPGVGRLHMYPPTGYYNTGAGTGVYADSPDFIAANILSGKNIFGVAGTAIAGKRFASGSFGPSYSGSPWVSPGASYLTFYDPGGNSYSRAFMISISNLNLGFTPSLILILNNTYSYTSNGVTAYLKDGFYTSSGATYRFMCGDLMLRSLSGSLEYIPIADYGTNGNSTWYAWE